MRIRNLILAPVLVVALASFAADTVVEEIVARINNDIITRGELQREREQMLQGIRQNGGDESKSAEHEKDVLRDLIDRQLLLQKGKDLGITGDTELIKRLDAMRKQMNLESMEDLEKAAQQQGVSFEDYKQNLREGIITQAVISREVGSRIQITNEETQKFYNDHRQEMERPEQVRLSEILIALPQAQEADKATEPTPEQLAETEKKARDVLAELKKGAKFEDSAKKYSGGPTAAQGGDIGEFKRGTMAKQLEDVTFAMKAGEISDVIRTRQGFVILKVTEHVAAGIPALKDVEPQLQEAVYMQKLEPSLRQYLTKLREEAFIDIKPGYIDSGASPNQTKPVITTTASVAEGKGKLKRKKKLGVF
jgi:peptidyl-prolyl cis-trans isomerase SurA